MKEENEAIRAMRLEITAQTGNVIKTGMELLGIVMPERM